MSVELALPFSCLIAYRCQDSGRSVPYTQLTGGYEPVLIVSHAEQGGLVQVRYRHLLKIPVINRNPSTRLLQAAGKVTFSAFYRVATLVLCFCCVLTTWDNFIIARSTSHRSREASMKPWQVLYRTSG